jgi:hypothetical protein
MKLIISQSQLRNITQKVVSEQNLDFLSKPEDYDIGSYLKKEVERQIRAKEPKGVGYGIYQTGKGWSSGTPLEKDFGEILFGNYPLGDIFYPGDTENWSFTKDGGFYVTDKNNTKLGDGTWKFSNGHVVINYGDRVFNSGTNEWTDKYNQNANCASSLDEIKEGSVKILKYGCKNDAVKELQKLLNMEEKYQTGYFGPITKGKVNEFQTSNGLKVDGIVGPKTYAALLQPKTPTDTSGLGVDDDIDQFNKQQTNESINTLKKVFNKLK